MMDLNTLRDALVDGDKDRTVNKVKMLIDQGIPARDILQKGLIAGMDVVGERMEEGEMFIPEVLKSGLIMSIAVEILKPFLADEKVNSYGKIVIGTVKGDLHDIGKNLVIMMLESSGFEVYDLGIDVAPASFVKAIRETKPDLLALSALLTTTMPMMKTTIEILEQEQIRDQVKVMIGGAPIDQEFADEIGADGYAPDAGSAVRLANALLK